MDIQDVLTILKNGAEKPIDKSNDFTHGKSSGEMQAYSHAWTLVKNLSISRVVVPKGTLPYPHKHQLERIDQLNQTQTDLKHQLQILRHFANKLGLYDASDYLKEK